MERYDYRKLLGKMREQKVTQEVLAENVGISATSMNLSLNNKRDFRQEEILVICESLDISLSDIPTYFLPKIFRKLKKASVITWLSQSCEIVVDNLTMGSKGRR